MQKKIFITTLLLLVTAVVVLASGAIGKVKPFYTGDAIVFNDRVFVTSANLDKIQLFKLEGSLLVKTADIVSSRFRYSGFDSFYDVLLNVENGNLFIYAVDGPYLYKYNATDPYKPSLVSQIKDNSGGWDWLLGLEKKDGYVSTVSKVGLKTWRNGDVFDMFRFTKNKDYYNVSTSQEGDYIYNLEDSTLKVYDTFSRDYVATIELETKDSHNRKIWGEGRMIYVADDQALKAMDFAGSIISRFNFTSDVGYDVQPSFDDNYIYFTDGQGVVKVTKSNLKPVKWAYTYTLGGSEGWAMGLKVVKSNNKEYVVVFNNSNILVLDSNLSKVASYASTETDQRPTIVESMFLRLSKNRAAPGNQIVLSGGGFGANEPLSVTFGKTAYNATAGSDGRFTTYLIVPNVLPGGLDIRVEGQVSHEHYSIGFLVE